MKKEGKLNLMNENGNSNQPIQNPHIWPPFTQLTSSKPQLLVEKAKGALLLPKDRAPIIDGISSWWSLFMVMDMNILLRLSQLKQSN